MKEIFKIILFSIFFWASCSTNNKVVVLDQWVGVDDTIPHFRENVTLTEYTFRNTDAAIEIKKTLMQIIEKCPKTYALAFVKRGHEQLMGVEACWRMSIFKDWASYQYLRFRFDDFCGVLFLDTPYGERTFYIFKNNKDNPPFVCPTFDDILEKKGRVRFRSHIVNYDDIIYKGSDDSWTSFIAKVSPDNNVETIYWLENTKLIIDKFTDSKQE